MDTKTYQAARKWMIREVAQHIDDCGEVNYTSLAEACADDRNIYVDSIDYEIPDELFVLAVWAGDAYLSRVNYECPRCGDDCSAECNNPPA